MPKRFRKIYIEISNVCNLRCSFCPLVVRGKKFMEPALFKEVATAAAPLTDVVCFHLMGEPFLHPQFESYLNVCGSLGLRVELTTNGVLLGQSQAKALLNPALSQINFSLQSFESNFPEKDNSLYLQKIFDFTQRAVQVRPDLHIYYRFWNDGAAGARVTNDRMIQKIRKGLGVDFKPHEEIHRRKNVHIKGRVYLHRDVRFEWPSPSQPIRSTTGFCHGMSSHIGILADGTVVPCCLDMEGVMGLGNCSSKRLSQIINSTRAQAIYKGFRKGILVEDLCQRCTFISRFDKHTHRMKKAMPQSA